MSVRSVFAFPGKKFLAISAGMLAALAGALVIGSATPAQATSYSVCASGCDATTIQGAINAASDGDTIVITAGTFTENLTIDKYLHIQGAGSGAAEGTVITSALANTPVVKITGSGTGTADVDMLSLSAVRLTGATGAGNLGAGVLVQGATAQSNVLLSNVVVTGNGGYGVALNGATMSNFKLADSTVTANTGAGLRVASAVSNLNGFTVSNTTVSSNSGAGLDVNPSQAVVTQTNFAFTDVNFYDNSSNANNVHQISLLGFTGNASFTRVNVRGAWLGGASAGGHGVVISGISASRPAIGNVILSDVTLTGAVKKGALLVQLYGDTSHLAMNNVDLSGMTAPWGQYLDDHTGGNATALGNTKLKTASVWNSGNIDATSARFVSVADSASLSQATDAGALAISAQVVDRMDTAGLGLVSIRSGHQFVTPVNALTGTSAGPLARAVAIAASGDVIHVAAGSYPETLVINKPLTLRGVQNLVDPSSAGRSGGESQLTGTVPVSITSDDVTVEGFEITSFNTAVAIPSPFSGVGYERKNVKLAYNWIHDAAMDYAIDVAPGLMNGLTIDHNIITKTELQSGELIHVSTGTSADSDHKLTNLVISNNELAASGDHAILDAVASKTSVKIDGLTFTGNWVHPVLGGTTDISCANLSNGTVSGNQLDSVLLTGSARSSVFSGNNFASDSRLVLEGTAAGYANDLAAVEISRNLFAATSNNAMVAVDQPTAANDSFTLKNNFFDSAVDDVAALRVTNSGTGIASAAYNWWGSAAGPATKDRVGSGIATSPYLTGFVADTTKAVAPTSWPLSTASLTAAPGFWPTEVAYVTALPAGTTSAAVETEAVGQIDLGLVAGDTPVEITIGDVVSPDLADSPFVVGDGALFELEITGVPTGEAVEICVYSANQAAIWHYEDGAWVDITSSYDAETGRLCGSTTHFSPFAIAPEKTPTVANIDATIGATSASSSKYGETVVFDSSIDQAGATGTLTVKVDGVLEATCAANSLAGCLPSRSDLSVGDHTITLDYDGDDNYKPSSTSLSWTVAQNDVTSTSSVTPTSSTHGDTVTMTGAYAGISATGVDGPTGTVTFYVDGLTMSDEFSSCTLSGGTCNDTVTDLPAGDHTIYVVYGGDSNYNSKTESFNISIAKFDTWSIYAGLTAVSPTYGAEYGFSYEIHGATNGLLPSGTIDFYLDPAGANTLVGSCTLGAGVCQPSAQFTSVGNHTIKVVYSGDNNYESAEDTYDYTVAKAAGPVVTPKTITQSFGTAAPTSLYTASGLASGDSFVTDPSCLLYASDDTAHEGSSQLLSASTPIGSYLLFCDSADAGGNYEATTYGADGVVTITVAPTTLDYTGQYFVGAGSTSVSLQATMGGICRDGATLTFYRDTDANGTYETLLATVTTNSSGVASYNWTLPTGVTMFDIEVRYEGGNCQAAAATATIVIGSSGDTSNGGGWYNLNGKMSFGYTGQTKTVKGVTTTTGQLIWNSKNGYKLKGTITGYSLTTCPTGLTGKCAVISGTGIVSVWDGLTATWTKPSGAVGFTAKVLDGGTSTVCSTVKKVTSCTTTVKPDYFSINISNFVIVGESNTLTQLKGGNITVK